MAATATLPVPKVLIVEDDSVIYRATSMLLKHYEFDVAVAATLKDGREKLASWNPDVMVLDLNLPDGDGIELLEKIRMGAQKTRVFILTGDKEPKIERKIRRLCPEGFFFKPLNFIEILEGIRANLKQKPLVTATATR